MKPIQAVIIALFAGAVTFELQNNGLEPQAHAAGFHMPTGPDWRQQLIARDPGAQGVDRELARLTGSLELSAEQAGKIRPLLQQRHDRILALLLTGRASLTLHQFLTERRKISGDMHDRLDALLTTDQLALESDQHSAVRA